MELQPVEIRELYKEAYIPMKVFSDGSHFIGKICHNVVRCYEHSSPPVKLVEQKLKYYEEVDFDESGFDEKYIVPDIDPDLERIKRSFDKIEEKERNKKVDSAINELFRTLKSERIKNAEIKVRLQDKILSDCPDLFDSDEELEIYIDNYIERKIRAYKRRMQRLKRKAGINKWNYWVTLTYDSKKMNESDFRTKLKRTLSNFAYRRGWKYMGVFELSPENDRLHFHGLFYIPPGQMIGSISVKKDYSTRLNKMQEININSFFEKVYGRNDFEKIDDNVISSFISYLVKYISKDDEKIIYSRGVPAEIFVECARNDIVTDYRQFHYILRDDLLNSDYKYNVHCPNLKFGRTRQGKILKEMRKRYYGALTLEEYLNNQQ